MEVYQLRTFVTVASEGNLTRASERLCISQPAVSGHIKTLEEELGVVLFDRTPKGMKVTGPGEALLKQAQVVLAAHQGLLDQAALLSGQVAGSLRIGIVCSAETLRLGDFLARVASRYPALRLQLRQGNSGTILNDVRSGKFDAGYVVGETSDPSFVAIRLRRLSMHVVAPIAWKERVSNADWSDVLRLPWVGSSPQSFCGQIADQMFRENGIQPVRIVESDHEYTTRSLVAAGMGMGLMHEESVADAVRSGEVVLWKDMQREAELMFVYRREREHDPLFAALVPLIREAWSDPVS